MELRRTVDWHHRQRGRTLVGLVVVLCLTALIAAAGIPTLTEARRAAALREASGRLWGMLVLCRANAIMRCRATALIFERTGAGAWRCFVAEDGDGDGLRRVDIVAGRDRVIGEVLHLEGTTAGLGILADRRVPDPSGRGRLDGDLDDPVRAGRGDIITFTPRSTATPSSIYLTDYHDRMRVLRITPGTGRVYGLVWRTGWKRWRTVGL